MNEGFTREATEDLRRGKRNVQEETNSGVRQRFTDHLGYEEQVVVVNNDYNPPAPRIRKCFQRCGEGQGPTKISGHVCFDDGRGKGPIQCDVGVVRVLLVDP
jgi:hypothetical protein